MCVSVFFQILGKQVNCDILWTNLYFVIFHPITFRALG